MTIGFIEPIYEVMEDRRVTPAELSWFMWAITVAAMAGIASDILWGMADVAAEEVEAL